MNVPCAVDPIMTEPIREKIERAERFVAERTARERDGFEPIPNGTPVAIRRPHPNAGPVNHEGHLGHVLDYTDVSRGYLVQIAGIATPKWFEAEVVARVTEPKTTPPASSGSRDAEQAAVYARGFVAEPEGHDDHLGEIERDLAVVKRDLGLVRTVAPLLADHPDVPIASGYVAVPARVAFVPKG